MAFLPGAYEIDRFLVEYGEDGQPIPLVTHIYVDDVEVTPEVIFSSTRFTSSVNGRPGSCNIRVRDTGHNHAFVQGVRVVLIINDTVEWTGYLASIRRGYFVTGTVTGPDETARYFDLGGVDINILFQKRILYDKVTETKGQLSDFPPGTPDSTVLLAYVEDHLDLSSDDLGTDRIEHVGTPSTDADIMGTAGWTWDQFMRFLTFNTGAIYYIDPDRQITLVDEETPDSPFGITDWPSGTNSGIDGDPIYVGCRDLEQETNADRLKNDVLAWGIGQGAAEPVFARATDNSSISDYGLWQDSVFTQVVWRQETIDRIADSHVFGSPQNRRGGNQPIMAVRCKIFRQGIRAGMKVEVLSAPLQIGESLPVRDVEITFLTPSQPQWQLTLTHDIDPPWTTNEFWFPDFNPGAFLPPYIRGLGGWDGGWTFYIHMGKCAVGSEYGDVLFWDTFDREFDYAENKQGQRDISLYTDPEDTGLYNIYDGELITPGRYAARLGVPDVAGETASENPIGWTGRGAIWGFDPTPITTSELSGGPGALWESAAIQYDDLYPPGDPNEGEVFSTFYAGGGKERFYLTGTEPRPTANSGFSLNPIETATAGEVFIDYTVDQPLATAQLIFRYYRIHFEHYQAGPSYHGGPIGPVVEPEWRSGVFEEDEEGVPLDPIPIDPPVDGIRFNIRIRWEGWDPESGPDELDEDATYQFKGWPAGDPEPEEWVDRPYIDYLPPITFGISPPTIVAPMGLTNPILTIDLEAWSHSAPGVHTPAPGTIELHEIKITALAGMDPALCIPDIEFGFLPKDTVPRRVCEDLHRVAPPEDADETSTYWQMRFIPTAGSEAVYLNGVLLRPGIDYTLVAGESYVEIFDNTVIDMEEDVVSSCYDVFVSFHTPPPLGEGGGES